MGSNMVLVAIRLVIEHIQPFNWCQVNVETQDHYVHFTSCMIIRISLFKIIWYLSYIYYKIVRALFSISITLVNESFTLFHGQLFTNLIICDQLLQTSTRVLCIRLIVHGYVVPLLRNIFYKIVQA